MNIRILHIVGDSKFGGASFGIIRLARHWKSLNWDVQILSTDGELQRLANSEGVGVLPLDVIWRETRPIKDLLGLWRLYGYLKRSRYTLVHTHTTKAGFVGRIAAKMARVPIVVHTAHGFAFHETSPWWKKSACTVLDRLASFGCKRVIAVSHFHQEWGRKLGIAAKEKIIAISNGIPDPFKPDVKRIAEIRGTWGIKPGDLAVLTPGRLAPEKGLEDLIDAITHVEPEVRARLRVLIAGDGVLSSDLQRRVSTLKLEKHVSFLGFQNNIPELLCAADLVVLPTWREGLSIALLEAMAQGCPILTTRIGSNLEVTRNGAGAHLVSAGCPEQLGRAIATLAGLPETRRALGQRAREIYLENYTLDRMLSQYHTLYEQLFEELEDAHTVPTILSSSHR
ncbi:MAG: glycosyltransferase family 4 protein [Bryobacterales bacterium]|nr:glycosyltransferase family 4 protein [Bryobacterales bacterium]